LELALFKLLVDYPVVEIHMEELIGAVAAVAIVL
jgi:hypothetical protein